MADFQGRYGQWGLVAGAAEGLGAAYCEALARRNMHVILVDIDLEKMESLALKLESSYQVLTRCVLLDLADSDAPERCMEVIEEVNCRLLIYNAAYSRVKPFLSAGREELKLYLNVNAMTPLRLVHGFANYLKAGGTSGGILLMSSLAGLWGTKLVAVYSGTKAFNLALAEALSYELKPYEIDVSACCAGATATPGYLRSSPSYGFIRPNVMEAGKVATYALNSLGKKTIIIPGFMNRLTYFLLTRILPRSLSSALVNKTMANTYKNLSE